MMARLLLHIDRMRRDIRGVSAIEFAMVVPLLIVLYVATVEIGSALTIHRRTSNVAVTAADLTAQVKSVTKGDIKDIQAAATSILNPYSTTPLTIVLSSVVADVNNNGKVAWSCASKGSARAEDSAYPVPAGLTEANSSVIVAEVAYAYTGLLGLTEFFNPGSYNMTRTFYTRPRQSAKVDKTDVGC